MGMGKLFPLWDFASPAAAPFGLPMCQNRIAIPTWSFAMERLPPKRIIEIGTYSGGFITALALHARAIDCKVHTWDRAFPDERVVPIGTPLGVKFHTVADVFAAPVVDKIGLMIADPGTTYVLCDGGDKPRELALFARYLKPGDVIAAHDYVPEDGPIGNDVHWPCSEIKREHGDAVAREHGLDAWMQDYFDLAAWLAYRKH